jgi:hypothetical protein
MVALGREEKNQDHPFRIAGVDYARQSLSKTGVDGPYINTIIEAALKGF